LYGGFADAGLYGSATSGLIALGTGTGFIGAVEAIGQSIGVYAAVIEIDDEEVPEERFGIFATAAAEGASATFAGFFEGDVEVTGNLAKGSGTFKIDHPLDPANKYLYHSFVESPDMMNIYNGNI